ncbi:MAG: ImmA/IrrE family metallo-endopeptidase [Gammaproteobacteria bacterium]|nr:ImmA/IrrE family metallo-endopeptidase [Gammaproteobacteria bacterium]
MSRRKRSSRSISAAERRLRTLAPEASTLRETVADVVARLMLGVRCPPTDLAELGQKVGVYEIRYESIPGSGEVHKGKEGFRIICSSDQPHGRQRFTVAHELAHVILENTGKGAPRAGESVERICDMLAAECLMPTARFESFLPPNPSLDDVSRLAGKFDTSITATAIRCGQLRAVSVFGVAGDRVKWGYGGVRGGSVSRLPDDVRVNVKTVMSGGWPDATVYFHGGRCRGSYRGFEWIRSGPRSAVFLLRALDGSPGSRLVAELRAGSAGTRTETGAQSAPHGEHHRR